MTTFLYLSWPPCSIITDHYSFFWN